MAIKINNDTVIDNDKKFIPVTIEAQLSTGFTGQVLYSTQTGIKCGIGPVAYNIIFGS